MVAANYRLAAANYRLVGANNSQCGTGNKKDGTYPSESKRIIIVKVDSLRPAQTIGPPSVDARKGY
ncbi:MAG: hypothetical protein HXK20_00320 [Alloprevotella tannerae]|nr:hypothetical protein [Alloprevotella tannerae]